ncbi:hypothetical protein Ae201684P_006905 [Aphanomyces euteiches]|uniref:Uncharacterized protein n=1 Tax=Aphanomyces euteiches TaxID=100861 RepID=A0A6G0W9W4_9STRA|nr:hypothetical protein Ae201684_017221 [Aphanomyces euteiches]KAH9100711.1 hypothetical protein Ae201684P_006905 [Aphanomyces euteiches]
MFHTLQNVGFSHQCAIMQDDEELASTQAHPRPEHIAKKHQTWRQAPGSSQAMPSIVSLMQCATATWKDVDRKSISWGNAFDMVAGSICIFPDNATERSQR